MRGDVIRQGEDCWVEAGNIIDKRTGVSIDVTGFIVKAVAQSLYERNVLGRPALRLRMYAPVVAEWSTSPTGTQGTILAGGDVPDRVQIHITPEQSSGWRCPLVNIQAEMTDPLTGFKSRIIDETYEVSYETVRI